MEDILKRVAFRKELRNSRCSNKRQGESKSVKLTCGVKVNFTDIICSMYCCKKNASNAFFASCYSDILLRFLSGLTKRFLPQNDIFNPPCVLSKNRKINRYWRPQCLIYVLLLNFFFTSIFVFIQGSLYKASILLRKILFWHLFISYNPTTRYFTAIQQHKITLKNTSS